MIRRRHRQRVHTYIHTYIHTEDSPGSDADTGGLSPVKEYADMEAFWNARAQQTASINVTSPSKVYTGSQRMCLCLCLCLRVCMCMCMCVCVCYILMHCYRAPSSVMYVCVCVSVWAHTDVSVILTKNITYSCTVTEPLPASCMCVCVSVWAHTDVSVVLTKNITYSCAVTEPLQASRQIQLSCIICVEHPRLRLRPS